MSKMQIRVAALLIVCGVATASARRAPPPPEGPTPVDKVLQLLEKLQARIEKEGKAEAAQYDKYACFCKEEASDKLYAIEKSDKKIAKWDAESNALDAEINALAAEINDLNKEIARLEDEIQAGRDARMAAHEKYVTEEADASAAIDAINGAIKAMEDSKGAMSEAKLNALLIQLTRRLKQEPVKYEYRSNEILGVLKGLLEDFTNTKNRLDAEEFDSRAQFEQEDQAKVNMKDFTNKDKTVKDTLSEKKSEEKAQIDADNSQENKDRAADQKFMKVLTEDCEEKASLWDQRSRTRADELTAISKALEELKDGVGVKANFESNKNLVGLQRGEKPTSFLQLRSGRKEIAMQKVLALLSGASSRLGSSALAVAAARVQLSADHFVKVRAIIADLVKKLEADAAAEAKHKDFCDKEITKATTARDAAQVALEANNAETATFKAEYKVLEEAITELTKTIAANYKTLEEMKTLRDSEKLENDETVRAAKEGKEAVEAALSFLNDFYGNAFVQYVPTNSDREGKTVDDKKPEIFDETYHGRQDSAKGIVGLLDIIVSDFERTISSVEEDESNAQDNYDKAKDEIDQSISDDKAEKDAKTARKGEVEGELQANEEEGKLQTDLLDTQKKELQGLTKMCIKGEETYEERVARRNQEIEALQQALTILRDWQA